MRERGKTQGSRAGFSVCSCSRKSDPCGCGLSGTTGVFHCLRGGQSNVRIKLRSRSDGQSMLKLPKIWFVLQRSNRAHDKR